MPNLATINQRPSWCNLHGKIDRSACVEVRVSELRRLAGCVVIDRFQRDERGRPLHQTFPLPNQSPASKRFVDGSRRLCSGSFTVTAPHLHALHLGRQPRTLAGDFRTSRANVMRSAGQTPFRIHHGTRGTLGKKFERANSASSARSAVKYRSRVTRNQPIAWPPDRNLPGNPNKGACRSKIIGLTADWSQPIRIEKWQYPRRIRPVYFLICPGELLRSGVHHGTRGTRGNKSQFMFSSASSASSAVNCLPGLSTRKPGREDPSTKKCPQRCLKLMMVQCTEAEAADADAAQLWINSLPERLRLREPYHSFIHTLIARYGPIFEPRVLLCPRCLKVHYGNNPETVRQGWRRRHGKPDTSIAGNAHLLSSRTPMDQRARDNYEQAWEKVHGVPWMERENPDAPRARRQARRAARRRETRQAWRRRTGPTRRARQTIKQAGLAAILPHLHNEEELLGFAASVKLAGRKKKRSRRKQG